MKLAYFSLHQLFLFFYRWWSRLRREPSSNRMIFFLLDNKSLRGKHIVQLFKIIWINWTFYSTIWEVSFPLIISWIFYTSFLKVYFLMELFIGALLAIGRKLKKLKKGVWKRFFTLIRDIVPLMFWLKQKSFLLRSYMYIDVACLSFKILTYLVVCKIIRLIIEPV